jgi:hypothetical protein
MGRPRNARRRGRLGRRQRSLIAREIYAEDRYDADSAGGVGLNGLLEALLVLARNVDQVLADRRNLSARCITRVVCGEP